MSWLYLAGLIFSIAGLTVLDKRYKLALFFKPKRTVLVLAIMISVFVVWDILGIGFNIFYKGDSAYLSGIVLGPEFPLEELFFLLLLSYVSLLSFLGGQRWNR
ncbi:lycopene cyclase domain-containing protein [Candidatus Saccharibacteria bacterium]|nr:lycopene cyclase domain-containing protein [Candidatus Saccharibacteria bacterium]